MTTTRDMIRDRIFGGQVKRKVVALGDLNVVVRSPTFGERSVIIERATIQTADGTPKMDLSKLQSYALVTLCYDEEGKRVFAEQDIEPLLATAVTDEMDDLINACITAINVRKEDVEEVGNG